MTIEEFNNILTRNDISPENVCFNNNIADDVFCVRENYNKIEVFYRERGNEYGMQTFQTLSEALEYLLDKMLKMTGKSI